MLFSPTGWNAIFKPYRIEPVVGWDDYGDAMIVDSAQGRRISVRELPDHDFENLEPTDGAYIGALPADGWTLRWPEGDVDKVIGFAVQPDGYALPILHEIGGAHGRPYYAEPGEPAGRLVPPQAVQ